MLAAMAAAAIASGAVALPEVGVAAGTFVDATVTGIATATGFGVVADERGLLGQDGRIGRGRVCRMAGLSVDFAVPAFEAPDFVWDGWAAPAPVGVGVGGGIGVASEGGPALALLSSDRCWRTGWQRGVRAIRAVVGGRRRVVGAALRTAAAVGGGVAGVGGVLLIDQRPENIVARRRVGPRGPRRRGLERHVCCGF